MTKDELRMKRFVVADLHFGHENIIKYEKRPFADYREMDKKLIEDWNSIVGKNDLVYVLGDFTLTRRKELITRLVNKLNGRKVLIMGNHDTRKPKDYIECGFEVATRKPMMVEPGVILMHEPFNDDSLIYGNYIYFFGHVHANRTMMDDYRNCMCVSVERVDYKPVDLDKAIRKLRKEKMRRELDGMYFRFDNESICFSDLTEKQQDEVMENRDIEWFKRMCKHLAKVLKQIGDEFDIVSNSVDEEGGHDN